MDDLMFSYHKEMQAERERRGLAGDVRRRVLVQRRARRRLARAERTALRARLLLAASTDLHALVPSQRG